MELSQKDIDALWETHDEVIAIKNTLGNGNRGLCHDVKENTRRISRIEILLAFAAGGGGITGGIIGIQRLLGG